MGETHFVLRGYIDGPPLYRSLIRTSAKGENKRHICVVALMQFPVLPKLIGLTDTGITVAPDFGAKMAIIKNAADLFSRLGYESPQVGIMAARRGLNDDLDSVSDAIKLKEAFAKGEFTGCRIVDGFSLSDSSSARKAFSKDSTRWTIPGSRISYLSTIWNSEISL